MNLRSKKLVFALCCIVITILFCTVLASTQILKTVDAMDMIIVAVAFGYMVNAGLRHYEQFLQKRWEE